MQLERMKLLSVLSEALDCVEQEFLGVTSHHAKRVALLCDRMAHHLNLSMEEKTAVFIGALLHDSALTEYREGYGGEAVPMDALSGHCVAGEENLRLVPGAVSRNFVLYHHERADGKGPFGKTAAETPGLSRTPTSVILASSRLHVMPLIISFSTISPSSQMVVPTGFCSKLETTRRFTRYFIANSTERVCNTFAPKEAISNISS